MLSACLSLVLAASATDAPAPSTSCSTLFEGSLAAKDVRAAGISPALAAVSPTDAFVAWEASAEPPGP
ncbi:MAG: hypothetical protein QM765_23425 [Myxococcales bacterium]